jgi:DNA-binding transcriptional regulator/RsmH inhibitor MraZ
MSLRNEMLRSLENIKNVFGSEKISETEVINRIASAPSYSERFTLALQFSYLKEYVKEPNRVFYDTAEPAYYFNFGNPKGILEKILSPPDVGPFMGQYERRNVNGRVTVPPEIKEILNLKPVLMPNQAIFDEIEKYLVLFPSEVWEKYAIMGFLTSKNPDKLFREICLNIYRPLFGKYIDLPEHQANSVGIQKNGHVTWVGVGIEAEIWDSMQWVRELDRLERLLREMYA